MKELNFIKIIEKTLSDNSFLGNDCAYLEDLGIYVTQDTLVENVHFSMHTTTPFLLAKKAINVNLSDLAAALAVPKYVTISLSLPEKIDIEFIEEFYNGINEACNELGIKVIGGDITGSENIVISVCAIGKKDSKYKTSRNYAKKDNLIVVTGSFGSSSSGLYSLQNFLYGEDELIDSHLNPKARLKESSLMKEMIKSDIAVMDTSDGLVDALYKIASSSKHSIEIEYNKIPVKESVKNFSNRNNLDIENFILWGGEDFELVFCIDEEIYEKLDDNYFHCIGRVLNKDNNPNVIIKYTDKEKIITKEIFENKTYNHFGNQKND